MDTALKKFMKDNKLSAKQLSAIFKMPQDEVVATAEGVLTTIPRPLWFMLVGNFSTAEILHRQEHVHAKVEKDIELSKRLDGEVAKLLGKPMRGAIANG